ncbi:MAG: SDR family oxidoreductase [Candidatus Sericytochromatia bacterium]|nr:SDR family oxidoreductase [Candidatus Sericytochromatia bacterium]
MSQTDTSQQPVVIITGASRGIGAAIAETLSGMQYRVALVARSIGPLDELASRLPNALAVPGDLTNESDVARVISDVLAKWGRIDVLINNAGSAIVRSVQSATRADYDAMMNGNFLSTFLMTRGVLPAMSAQGKGHILNMASIAAKRTFPNWSLYCASKFAMIGFSQALAQEVRPLGIQVTDLYPGSVDSPLWDGMGMDAMRAAMLQPADVAEMVAYTPTQSKRARIAEIVLEPSGGDL